MDSHEAGLQMASSCGPVLTDLMSAPLRSSNATIFDTA